MSKTNSMLEGIKKFVEGNGSGAKASENKRSADAPNPHISKINSLLDSAEKKPPFAKASQMHFEEINGSINDIKKELAKKEKEEESQSRLLKKMSSDTELIRRTLDALGNTLEKNIKSIDNLSSRTRRIEENEKKTELLQKNEAKECKDIVMEVKAIKNRMILIEKNMASLKRSGETKENKHVQKKGAAKNKRAAHVKKKQKALKVKHTLKMAKKHNNHNKKQKRKRA